MNKTPYKIDLHTHSIISYDGGLSEKDYTRLLSNNILDFVAITDHNEINFATYLQRKLGEKIIVGEEIKTLDGEIIGLFLKEKVFPKKTSLETIKHIHSQNGVVYIPHPFEKQRESISYKTFLENKNVIDILEMFNARSFGRQKTHNIKIVAKQYNITSASSSDAHCRFGIGTAYSIIKGKPEQESITKQLRQGLAKTEYAPIVSYLCPFINKLIHKLHI